jgi:hypothetical protein
MEVSIAAELCLWISKHHYLKGCTSSLSASVIEPKDLEMLLFSQYRFLLLYFINPPCTGNNP